MHSCCVCLCVSFILAFFVTFRFFLLIKDNSNNIFLNIFCLLPSHFLSLFAVCFLFFSLSFLLYCMVYYKKLFTSCFEPSQLALSAFFSLFLFEIYHWIINFKFNSRPPQLQYLSHSLQLLPCSLSRLILNPAPSLALLLLLRCPTHIYNCFLPLDNYYYAYY